MYSVNICNVVEYIHKYNFDFFLFSHQKFVFQVLRILLLYRV